MAIFHKLLWHLLVDRDLTKTDLRLSVGSCPATLARLSKDQLVKMNVLPRTCSTIKCDIRDVMAATPDKKKRN